MKPKTLFVYLIGLLLLALLAAATSHATVKRTSTIQPQIVHEDGEKDENAE